MCHVGLSLVAKKQTSNEIVRVLPIACMESTNVLFSKTLIRKNFLFQMGVIVGYLNKQLNVFNLKVPEKLTIWKIKGCACVYQGVN